MTEPISREEIKDIKENVKGIKENVKDLYDRNNKVMESWAETNRQLSIIATKLENMPQPEKQPCQFHKELKLKVDKYIENVEAEEKKNSNEWRSRIIMLVFNIIQAALLSLLAIKSL